MGNLLRWILVLVFLYIGISGLADWWKPVVVPSSALQEGRSISKVDLRWDSATSDHSIHEQNSSDSLGINRDALPNRGAAGLILGEPVARPQPYPVPVRSDFVRYTVLRGDTLSEIAQEFFGSVRLGTKKILESNPSIRENRIDIGQELVIPIQGAGIQGAGTPDARSVRESFETIHTVLSGETLSAIAQRYFGNEDYSRIVEENRETLSDPNRLKIGMKLRIPRDE